MNPRWALPCLLLLAGCGSVPADGPADLAAQEQPAAVRHAGSGTVLQSPEHGPQLCLGGVLTSLPPQCGGVPLVGWDWEKVEGEESLNGTTWGEYRVVGTFDGTSLTPTEPPGRPPDPAAPDPTFFDTPCEPPPGGWEVRDRSRAGEDDLEPATRYAMAQPDHAALWIDRQGASPYGPAPDGEVVLNVGFTGDLARHERELRALWGGPLCVLQRERTVRELRSVQDELSGGAAAELGLTMLNSSVLETRGVVELGVVVVTPDQQAALDERFGAGVVEVVPGLVPLS